MTTILKLDEQTEVENGAIKLTDIIAHSGQQPIARFHAWVADRYRDVEMRVGDRAQAGEATFELVDIRLPREGVAFNIVQQPSTAGSALFAEPFDIQLGQRIDLPMGLALTLMAVGTYGVQLLFKDSDECNNFWECDFGFWRVDGLLLLIQAFDRAQGTARITVFPEDGVNRLQNAAFGDVVSLGPKDVVQFPDGSTVRLRRAERQCYDAVDWNLLAHNGDDVSYPYAGSMTTVGEPVDRGQQGFALMGRRYHLRTVHMQLEPELRLDICITPETSASFSLGQQFHLKVAEFAEGPGGLRVVYRGSGHGHGTSMGPDGGLIPMTVAWADFGVFLNGVSSGFSVDLMDFHPPVTSAVLGYNFTVRSVQDTVAIVVVEPA